MTSGGGFAEAGEPGFEPGFTVLETALIAVRSLPRARRIIATPTAVAVRPCCEHVFVCGWRPTDDTSYAYLLGLYLGDGCVFDTGWSFQLRIHLDAAYPRVIEEAAGAMAATLPHRRVIRRGRTGWRVVILEQNWAHLPCVFPQHGPGRKHERAIVLADWQRPLVQAHPGAFVRGLIHSDGCRTVNRFEARLPSGQRRAYAYPRYFFSNRSPDIRWLFCEAGDQLGVRWTTPNERNISVSRRQSVALLDRHVGPKR